MKPLKLGKFEVEYPIIQGGMAAGISKEGLAESVSRNGGLGVVTAFGLTNSIKDVNNPKMVYQAISSVKEKGVFVGVNILYAVRNYNELVEASVRAGVDVIFTGAGLPLNLPSVVFESKTPLVPIISSKKAFYILIERWKKRYNYVPVAVVFEGIKAGGHLGFKGIDLEDNTENYDMYKNVKEVAELRDSYYEKYDKYISIIAAGGLFSREDLSCFAGIGVDGFQLGTRFVCTEESDAPKELKIVYVESKKKDLEIIKSPVGMPIRIIKNKFSRELADKKLDFNCPMKCLKTCNPQESKFCIAKRLILTAKGDVENGLITCGYNVDQIDKITTVKEIIKELSRYIK